MTNRYQLAVIDCQAAGISGDMLLGALFDLGADAAKVMNAIKSIETYVEGCKNLEVSIRTVIRGGLRARQVRSRYEGSVEMNGIELIKLVEVSVDGLNLSEKARRFASRSIETLVEAEAKLHGQKVGDVHLHEAGDIDTPVEIVGSAVALEDLGFFDKKVYSTPVAVGGGLFTFSHGTVSSPAPATLEILRLKSFPLVGGPIEAELATPTGVSILVSLVDEVVRFYPAIKPFAVGYGAGTKDFPEIPNVLRITIGEPVGYDLAKDEVFVLETNIDDVTGEVIGYATDKLLREGARDVSIIPISTKKNRPGQILKVIIEKGDVDRMARILMEETGSLGVRVHPVERRILTRESLPIEVEIGNINRTVEVKIAKDGKGEIVRIKPEYEDAKRISEETGMPLREVLELIQDKARKIVLSR